jgi:hypothetical protein
MPTRKGLMVTLVFRVLTQQKQLVTANTLSEKTLLRSARSRRSYKV